MQEQVLGYWVLMATQGGELQRWGGTCAPDVPFNVRDEAFAFADTVASKSTTDSIYVMTVYDDGSLSMWTICRPARDPARPANDAGSRPGDLDGNGVINHW
jgi:hypothetical protein